VKYFTVNEGGEEVIFTRVTTLRKHLAEHPEIESISRYWWSGCDLIEVTCRKRDEILKEKAKNLVQGMTAQWGAAHGRMQLR